MIGDLLLYLLVTDLRELSDEDLRDYLELLVGCPHEPLLDVQEAALEHLQSEAMDRDEIEGLAEDYSEHLPSSFADYHKTQEEFDEILEEFYENEEIEESDKVERFRLCLELLDESTDWQERSRAARGMGVLEEELFQSRNQYRAQPFHSSQCSPVSVVAHRNLLDGFEIWLDAFRLAHKGELDEALETAVEGTCVLYAVERWAQLHTRPN